MMKKLLSLWPTLLCAAALAGCGLDTASTAATGAVMKKQELEQGKKTMDQMQQKINQSMEQMQQSPQRAADAESR